MECKGGYPVPALWWQRPLEQIVVAHTLKWPSGLVCLANCMKKAAAKSRDSYAALLYSSSEDVFLKILDIVVAEPVNVILAPK